MGAQLAKNAREAAGKFMWTMAGNLPNFEEASRALYGKDIQGVKELIHDWPEDIRRHLMRLVDESQRLEKSADKQAIC
jgi:hypothetical protein